ncbi:helix-turn-helix domain-containing protein [Clostridium transplantifaecale]|uniref:helix-turn-helix domain-containing protein n=1 Tax=Clostridium transplantifaecale TaxID=2479838 RepID=UPI000F634FC5|nr:helix-turn-helix domain-containing protein [Clostridium transplantifaecale]
MFTDYGEIVTIETLCEMLEIGKNTAYSLLNNKKIKAFKIGRDWKIPRKAVEEYILNESFLK